MCGETPQGNSWSWTLVDTAAERSKTFQMSANALSNPGSLKVGKEQ